MARKKILTDAERMAKARTRVVTTTLLYYLMILVGFVGGVWILSSPALNQPDDFERIYLMSMIIQWVCMLGIFFLLTTGQRWARTIYWVFFTLECLTLALPLWIFFTQFKALIVCLIWEGLIIGKLCILYSLGKWLQDSNSGVLFFDKTLRISRSEDLALRQQMAREKAMGTRSSQTVQRQEQPVPQERPVQNWQRRNPDFEGGIDHPGITKEKSSASKYPKIAIRLGLTVYGSLILFPMLVQIFQNFFVSTDNQQVFATRLMFTACILSAVIWTIPVFFLYLKRRFSRTSVLLCLGMEVLAGLWFYLQLKGYYTSDSVQYPLHVFIWLGIIDAVRILAICWGFYPVFTIPVPESDEEDEEEEEDEEIPDDLIIADDSELYEDPEEAEKREQSSKAFKQALGHLREEAQSLLHKDSEKTDDSGRKDSGSSSDQ